MINKIKAKIEARKKTKNISLNAKESIVFAGSLLTLIERGVHLLDACNFMSSHAVDKKSAVISKLLMKKIEEGNTLSQGLILCDIEIPIVLRRYIAIGDETSSLAPMLRMALNFLTKEVEFRKKIIASLIYPSLIAMFGAGLISFLLGFIFPKIIPIVQSLHVPLPLSTRALIFLSSAMQNYWYMLILCGALIFFGLKYVYKTPLGYRIIWKLLLKVPLCGMFLKLTHGRAVAFTLSNYLKAGSPLSIALTQWEKNTKHFIHNEWLAVRHSIESGALFSESLESVTVLPTDFKPLVCIGEKAGSCEEGLETVSAVYEKRIEEIAAKLAIIIEPVIIVVLGLAVCGAALSIITPLYSMLSHVGKI